MIQTTEHTMTLQMSDKSSVSQRWVVDAQGNGHCKLTFHALGDKVVCLPIGMVPTLGFVGRLYSSLKGE